MKLTKILLTGVLALSLFLGACTNVTTRDFTLTELAEFDGLDGADAYIAVDGVVYDVTNADEWTNGSHKGVHFGGSDATAAFAGSPHTAEILADLPVVGNLVE